MIAKYKTNVGRKSGEVIKVNPKSILVRCGNNIIRRHIVKHEVEFEK